MSIGQELEGSKRMYSIRDEISKPDTSKRQKREHEHEFEGSALGLPSPDSLLLELDTRAPPMNLTLQIPRTPVPPDYRGLLEESKRATQETSVCCREMGAAEESVKYACARYVEAKNIVER
jgi:hypothetical protein